LLAAYISGSGPLFLDGIQNVFSLNLPNWTAPFWVLILFCPFLYAGLKAVDNINRVLMILMGVAFVLMLGLLFGHVDANLLAYTDTSYTLISLSVVITSFGYHVIIPSLTTYLDRDLKQIKLCVLLGSSLPFVIYFAWELVILGTIPVAGEFGIAEIIKQGIPVSKSLSAVLNNSWVTGVVAVFAICAIVTSFLGVAQGLIDFLKDGFKVNHDSHAGHIGVFLAAFVPPLAFALFYPQGFIMALEWAGIFVAILLGLIPILMVWSLRYVKKIQTSYRAFGNRLFLSLGMLFFVFIVGLVFAKNLGFLN